IVHLAEELIRLSGKKPYEDIDITFTGLRPGEKLYEELLLDGEGVKPTRHEKICVADSVVDDILELKPKLEELYMVARQMDLPQVCEHLHSIVPEYNKSKSADDI
ncbi:MAG: polysaccharide biosynthesis protein, partial [Desulfuromonadaceae bacterium]